MIQITISHGKERTNLYCDKCGCGYTFDYAVSKSRLISIGRYEGWSMGKLHLCEKCRKGEKNETRRSD